MKFLLEILGMTNQCNLRCSYCDWVKDKYFHLREEKIDNINNNFRMIRKALDDAYENIQLVEYSGGETLMYSEIISILLKFFSDKWIRIVTNGVLINDEYIKMIKNHGKAYLTDKSLL